MVAADIGELNVLRGEGAAAVGPFTAKGRKRKTSDELGDRGFASAEGRIGRDDASLDWLASMSGH